MENKARNLESPLHPAAPMAAGGAKRFRRLKRSELVKPGDFVKDERLGFIQWDGPSGFRADSFVRPIYRILKLNSPKTRQ